MRIEPYLCLGGTEIANHARSVAYVDRFGVEGLTLPHEVVCAAYDEPFDTPATDPAPWWEPTRSESADFMGVYAQDATFGPPLGRRVVPSGPVGAVVGPSRLRPKVLTVTGFLVARSPEAMAYGKAWLTEALRGPACEGGSPDVQDLIFVEACPSDGDADAALRTLVQVGCADLAWGRLEGAPECLLLPVTFTLASAKAWKYRPADRCLDGAPLPGSLSCALTTPEWMGDGTFVVEIENIDNASTTDIVIEGQISLDGSCPVGAPASSVPPSWSYEIPELGPEDRIVIDGMRRQVRYYDASDRVESPGLPRVEVDTYVSWPDVGPCTTMCLTITASGGDAEVTVDAVLREA